MEEEERVTLEGLSLYHERGAERSSHGDGGRGTGGDSGGPGWGRLKRPWGISETCIKAATYDSWHCKESPPLPKKKFPAAATGQTLDRPTGSNPVSLGLPAWTGLTDRNGF